MNELLAEPPYSTAFVCKLITMEDKHLLSLSLARAVENSTPYELG